MNHIFFDFSLGEKPLGRVLFELFDKDLPKTCENFRCLSTGEHIKNNLFGDYNQFLTYKNTIVHKIKPDILIEGGDILNLNGKGGYSIFGEIFDDENFKYKHDQPGLLSMANSGMNSNSSKFFITLKPLPNLDNKNVVFGKVIYGLEVIKKISKVETDENNNSKIPIIVINCGLQNDSKKFLSTDPFDKDGMEKIIKENKKRILNFLEKKEESDDEKIETIIEKKNELDENWFLNNNSKIDLIHKKIKKDDKNEKYNERLLNLKLKLNEARVKNLNEVRKEENKSEQIIINKNKRKEKQRNKIEEIKLQKNLNNEEYNNLLKPIGKQKTLIKKKNSNFGWEIFSIDALYNAYEKNCKRIPNYNTTCENLQNQNQNELVEKRKEKLAEEIKYQTEKKSENSRIRTYDPEAKINYINNRNKLFIDKAKKGYKNYTKDIEYNLEKNK